MEAITRDGRGSGISHGDVLTALVDATLGDDQAGLERARRAVVDAVGEAGLVDAAGVIGAFGMQTRVADGTGLPLDAPIELASRSLRKQLGLDALPSAQRTPHGGWGRALASKLVEPVAPSLFRLAGKLGRRSS